MHAPSRFANVFFSGVFTSCSPQAAAIKTRINSTLLGILQYITKARKNRKTNYINHKRCNVNSDQSSLGFRVSHCPLQPTGVDTAIIIAELPRAKRAWRSPIAKINW